jgi:hypothetical protein
MSEEGRSPFGIFISSLDDGCVFNVELRSRWLGLKLDILESHLGSFEKYCFLDSYP